MTCSPTSRCRSRGFTLAEMMVAMAVLVLLIALLGQTVGAMSRTWTAGQRRVNNFTKARAMLDMFARDIQGGLFRADLAAFPISGPVSDVAFYTRSQGIAAEGVPRGVSLVQYRLGSSSATVIAATTLERGDMAVMWNSPATFVSFGNATTLPLAPQVAFRNTAPGVIAFKVVFVHADGTLGATYAPSAASPVRGVGMTIAVVDDLTLRQIDLQQAGVLRGLFDTASDGTRNVLGDWQGCLAHSIDWSSYPKSLGVGLRVFARYVSFPDF